MTNVTIEVCPRKQKTLLCPISGFRFIYSEEVDLCHRLRQGGWKIYWVPQAAVVHYGGQSTKQMPAEMFLRLYESKVLYFRKRHGRRPRCTS